ncbi:hypothetical protein PILCRDRAFT_820603 [Piloderma croceum F 1598]|uniref:Uncharacterized protein n=1 Tax=Piloderma croceum (strain F 1598) TaxID=765440 RepID=A0A0C3FR98_PILCF|nr:hypothetical protein PILCRDRAFT_820603 [Piloderma croceum F 1598]
MTRAHKSSATSDAKDMTTKYVGDRPRCRNFNGKSEFSPSPSACGTTTAASCFSQNEKLGPYQPKNFFKDLDACIPQHT